MHATLIQYTTKPYGDRKRGKHFILAAIVMWGKLTGVGRQLWLKRFPSKHDKTSGNTSALRQESLQNVPLQQ